MPVRDAALTYQQVSAHGRSPVGMIVALYDTILRDFGRALTALDASNVETRVFEMNHAVRVIGHLEEALDHQQGGEAAARFEQFYKMTRAMVVAATAKADRQSIRELIDLFVPMREAWQQAEQKLQNDPAQLQAAASNLSTVAATPSRRAPVTPSLEPEPSRGRWSA